jgi:hypothetical protein
MRQIEKRYKEKNESLGLLRLRWFRLYWFRLRSTTAVQRTSASLSTSLRRIELSRNIKQVLGSGLKKERITTAYRHYTKISV